MTKIKMQHKEKKEGKTGKNKEKADEKHMLLLNRTCKSKKNNSKTLKVFLRLIIWIKHKLKTSQKIRSIKIFVVPSNPFYLTELQMPQHENS